MNDQEFKATADNITESILNIISMQDVSTHEAGNRYVQLSGELSKINDMQRYFLLNKNVSEKKKLAVMEFCNNILELYIQEKSS